MANIVNVLDKTTGQYVGIPALKGDNGISPHIGANGNWFVGEYDTGKTSRGERGTTWYAALADLAQEGQAIIDINTINIIGDDSLKIGDFILGQNGYYGVVDNINDIEVSYSVMGMLTPDMGNFEVMEYGKIGLVPDGASNRNLLLSSGGTWVPAPSALFISILTDKPYGKVLGAVYNYGFYNTENSLNSPQPTVTAFEVSVPYYKTNVLNGEGQKTSKSGLVPNPPEESIESSNYWVLEANEGWKEINQTVLEELTLRKPCYTTTQIAVKPDNNDNNYNININNKSFEENRYYGIETDAEGTMCVNVPWTDTIASSINIIDNLTSSETNSALSAAQGKWLNENKMAKQAPNGNTQLPVYINANGDCGTCDANWFGAFVKNGATKSLASYASNYTEVADQTVTLGVNAAAKATGGTAIGFVAEVPAEMSCGTALGFGVYAPSVQGLALGKFNKRNVNRVLEFGWGEDALNGLNLFSLDTDGNAYAKGTFTGSQAGNADYAEMFEWADGNLYAEDRRGKFVTFKNGKANIASADDYIEGVVSANPLVLADTASDDWSGKYLTDVYGTPLKEKKLMPAVKNLDGEIVLPEREEEVLILNPQFNPELEYIPRQERQEWSAIGLLGKLIVIDDGSCYVGGFCKCGNEGIATVSAQPGYRVLERIDETHIKILFK